MTMNPLLEEIRSAMIKMNDEQLEHFKSLIPAILTCYMDESFSATVIIKEEKDDFGSVHSVNADDFQINDMLLSTCDAMGLNELQNANRPLWFH